MVGKVLSNIKGFESVLCYIRQKVQVQKIHQ